MGKDERADPPVCSCAYDAPAEYLGEMERTEGEADGAAHGVSLWEPGCAVALEDAALTR